MTAPVAPPTVTSTTPASGATGVAVSAARVGTFNKPVQPSSISFTLTDSASSRVGGTSGYNAANLTALQLVAGAREGLRRPGPAESSSSIGGAFVTALMTHLGVHGT